MKQIFYPVLLGLTLAFPMLVSCGDDSETTPQETKTDNVPDAQNEPSEEAWDQVKQKQYLQEVGQDFLAFFSPSEFSDIKELGMTIGSYFNNDYKKSALENWAESVQDAITVTLTEQERGNFTLKTARRLYAAASFNGQFTYANGKWTKTGSKEGISFTCKDKDGQTVVAELSTSGQTKTVYAFTDTDWDYDRSLDYWKETRKETYNYFAVPEHITVKLTQGSTTLVNVQVTTDLSSVGGEKFDIAKDAFTVSFTAKVKNYTFTSNRIMADGSKGASADFSISKNGQQLFAASASGNGSVRHNIDVNSDDFEYDDYKVNDWSASNVVAKADVLGKVQVSGTCKDIHLMMDYLKEAENNSSKLYEMQKWVDKANEQFSVGIFYGNSTQQASLRFDIESEEYNGRVYELDYIPVIVFSDGTAYAESFFSEKNFKKLIDAWENLFEDYEEMVEDVEDSFDDDDDVPQPK